MWCRGLESLRAARLARSQTTYRPELNVQCSGNRTSTRTVPLAAHVTSRHLSGYYRRDILGGPGDTPGSAPKGPSHLSPQGLDYSYMHSRRPRCPGSSKSPHKGRAGGQPQKCLGARAMRRGQGKEAPCFRLDLTGASGPHMSALHYRPPAAGGPLLLNECLA